MTVNASLCISWAKEKYLQVVFQSVVLNDLTYQIVQVLVNQLGNHYNGKHKKKISKMISVLVCKY